MSTGLQSTSEDRETGASFFFLLTCFPGRNICFKNTSAQTPNAYFLKAGKKQARKQGASCSLALLCSCGSGQATSTSWASPEFSW